MSLLVEPGQTLSHYRLIEKVGEGGTGAVWRAMDTRLDREVALKLLSDSFSGDPRRVARLEREAKVVASVSHPDIVTVHAVEEAQGRRFISMEFVRGRPLSDVIPAGGLPRARFLGLGIAVTDAIVAAHAQGVIHGDIKPGNVMVTADDRVKILDFGLSRSKRPESAVTTSDSATQTMTLEGRISGTVSYMSPERIHGKPLDAYSDVFSLGVLLYEMATGERPFRGETAADVIASVLKDQPRAPSSLTRGIPRHLDRVIGLCLAKNPDERISSASELHCELCALQRGAASGVNAGGARHSIAVLPFVDVSENQDQDYFCEGMSDEIIGAIMRVEGLRVTSRTSSFQFKGTSLDSREIGDRLGVGNLLEGSVRKVDNRLRISVQLINVADGYQLWAERYVRELKDVFAIQEEIAESIVEALAVTLSPRERRAIKQVATGNVEAYDYYLRGRQHFRQFRRKSIEVAKEMFAQAIRVDPNYAGAYAGLADCHSYLYMFWDVSNENLESAAAASRRAVELDPELAEAYVARGVAISLGKRHEQAGLDFETAIRLNPGLFEAPYFYARGFYARGKLEQAVRWFRRSMEICPEDYQAPALLGSSLAGLSRKAESNAAYRSAVELAEKHLEVHPGETRALYLGAIALCQLEERREQSLEWAERALAMDPQEPQVLYNVGCVYTLLGRRDEALGCLERTIAHGGWWKTWMKNDPDLSPLHEDPRFVNLVRGADGSP